MASDRLLDALRDIGDGATLSVGFPITGLTAGARIEGAIARDVDFAERFARDMADGMRHSAANFDDTHERAAVEELAKVFDAAPPTASLPRGLDRRRRAEYAAR